MANRWQCINCGDWHSGADPCACHACIAQLRADLDEARRALESVCGAVNAGALELAKQHAYAARAILAAQPAAAEPPELVIKTDPVTGATVDVWVRPEVAEPRWPDDDPKPS